MKYEFHIIPEILQLVEELAVGEDSLRRIQVCQGNTFIIFILNLLNCCLSTAWKANAKAL